MKAISGTCNTNSPKLTSKSVNTVTDVKFVKPI